MFPPRTEDCSQKDCPTLLSSFVRLSDGSNSQKRVDARAPTIQEESFLSIHEKKIHIVVVEENNYRYARLSIGREPGKKLRFRLSARNRPENFHFLRATSPAPSRRLDEPRYRESVCETINPRAFSFRNCDLPRRLSAITARSRNRGPLIFRGRCFQQFGCSRVFFHSAQRFNRGRAYFLFEIMPIPQRETINGWAREGSRAEPLNPAFAQWAIRRFQPDQEKMDAGVFAIAAVVRFGSVCHFAGRLSFLAGVVCRRLDGILSSRVWPWPGPIEFSFAPGRRTGRKKQAGKMGLPRRSGCPLPQRIFKAARAQVADHSGIEQKRR